MSNNFNEGDLVWAKMKGYPPWPGEIMKPPIINLKSPRSKSYYVFFYGSKNHAWISEKNIQVHNDKLVEEYNTKKRIHHFQKAVDTIIEMSTKKRASPKPNDPQCTFKNSSQEMPMKNRKSCCKRKKKFSGILRKSAKKRTSSPDKTETASVCAEKAADIEQLSPDTAESASVEKEADIEQLSPDTAESASVEKAADIEDLSPDTAKSASVEKAADIEDLYKQCFILNNIPADGDVDLNTAHSSAMGELIIRTYVERPDTPPIDLLKESSILRAKKIQPTPRKIGFLGLGDMGQGIVKNLRHSGHSIIIWNRTAEKCRPFAEKLGIEVASTPADVAKAADIIFCCISDLDAVNTQVYKPCGVLEGLHNCPGKGYVEMTSMDPQSCQEIAYSMNRIGCRYLEAPLKGSRVEANNGELFIQTSGDRSLYDDCRSCFEAISRSHEYLNCEVGYASKIKIVHSMYMGTFYCSLAEALALGIRSEIDPTDLLEIINEGVLKNDNLMNKGKKMIDKNYVCNTRLKYLQKDISYGLQLGNSVEQPTPTIAAANQVLKRCQHLRYGDHDASAVFESTKA